MTKSWWKSKTIWANVIAFFATMLGVFGVVDVSAEAQAEIVAVIMSVVNIALRFMTSEAIK